MDYPNHDRWGNPIFPNPETGEDQSWVRATTIAKALDDGGGLPTWTGAMVAGGAYLRGDLVGQIGARWPMTDENKSEIYGIVEKLKDAGGGSVGRNAGDTLHEMLRRRNQGDDFNPLPPWDADINAHDQLLAAFGIEVNPEFVEQTVCIPSLGIAGSADLFAGVPRLSSELVVTDYKTGKVADYVWAAWVVQLTIYAHAEWTYNWSTGESKKMPPVDRQQGLIIHVPAGSGSAELYEVDLEPGWRAIKAALWVRDWRKQAKTLARKARPTTKASA